MTEESWTDEGLKPELLADDLDARPSSSPKAVKPGEQTAESAPSSHADVVYLLSRIAEEGAFGDKIPNALNAGDLAGFTEVRSRDADGSSLPVPKACALVMARGRSARKIVQEATQAGIFSLVPFTKDRRPETYSHAMTRGICIGDSHSPALYANAHAALTAAEEGGASIILLSDESLPLAEVDSFLGHAAARGIRVFRPLTPKDPGLAWLLCEPPAGPYEEPHWMTCPHCKLSFDESSVAKHNYTCPSCGSLLRMSSTQRINYLLDIDSFEEWNADLEETDPLDFEGYLEKLEGQKTKTGFDESVKTGRGRIAGLPVVIGIMDAGFMMGSMGSVTGEKIARMVDRATEDALPVVILCASGGARMQEGLISLMQMAKISCAIERHAAAGLPFFSVITDPTTGGVTASFAMQGDVVLSEPGALIGFAGKRVIRDTIRQELPEGFQTAEFALEHGLIDMIVERQNLRATLAQLIALHLPATWRGDLVVDYESVVASLERGDATYNHLTYGPSASPDEPEAEKQQGAFTRFFQRIRSMGDDDKGLERQMQRAARKTGVLPADEVGRSTLGDEDTGKNNAWESVQLARNVHRPTSQYYLKSLVDGFIELHGDRAFADDGAIIGGIGWVDGRAVTIIAEEKGRDVHERVRRNFGCPQPEGYRKSLRLMRQAQKFNRPIICFVDTQGAFCGTEAEERGQGNAIAENLMALAGLEVPVISIIVGEGGSGGALALALANRVAMQKYAVYSILSPEGFASILWKDRSRAPEAAAAMKMSADDAFALGIVDAVLSEGDDPAHENPEQAARHINDYVVDSLRLLSQFSREELVRQRQDRFAQF